MHKRQIAVVGAGMSRRAVASTLRCAGYDASNTPLTPMVCDTPTQARAA